MKKKHSSADEIQIELFPKSSKNKFLEIRYIKHKKPDRYRKSINLQSMRPVKKPPIIFFISGVQYAVKSESQIRKFQAGIVFGTRLLIKHENKNKFDNSACAIYYKNLKIGYIPKDLNSIFLKHAKSKKYFSFYSGFHPILLEQPVSDLFLNYPVIAVPNF